MSTKLVRCGKLFDGVNEKYFDGASILVEDDRIVSVGSDVEAPEGCEIVDLSDKFVTPGLMEIHNHAVSYHDQSIGSIINDFMLKTSTYRALGIVRRLNELLEHGFTLVRDCAYVDLGWECIDIRNAFAEGILDGPTYVVCGHSGGIVGGHVDERQFIQNLHAQPIFESPNVGSGPEFFRNWVRTEYLHNVDFIKFHIDGGFCTPNDDPEHRHMAEDEIAAIIETAHACGLKATAHIYCDESARLAMKHGIDGIEHGALLKPETYDMMAESGTYLVPTMCFFDRGVFMDKEDLDKVPAYMAYKYTSKHDKLVTAREAIVSHIEDGSILVGYGTDQGAVEPMLPAWREYETMVRSGVSPFKALVIATSNSAKIAGKDDRGQIAEGMFADIVAWDEDPTENSRALRNCYCVIKNGKLVKKGDEVYKTGPRL